MTHDPLCPLSRMSMLKHGCPQCDLILIGRIAGLAQALEATDRGGRAAAAIQQIISEQQEAQK